MNNSEIQPLSAPHEEGARLAVLTDKANTSCLSSSEPSESEREKISVLSLAALFWMLLLGGLFLSRLHSYILFHSLVEVFSIVVLCSIFAIAWNAREFMDNNYFFFIGIASPFIGLFGILHTLAYEGMGIFAENGANLATQLWVSARFLQSASLVLAPLFIGRRLRPRLTLAAYSVVSALALLSIFVWKNFPVCFIESQGLTAFKIVSEYMIVLLLVLAVLVLMLHKPRFDRGVFRLLIASISAMVVSELTFTLYRNPFGFFNLLGHVLMFLSFYLLYRALITTGLKKPYNLLFLDLKKNERDLRESEKKYRRLSENLERTVQQKVAELRLAQRLAAIGEMVSVVAHEVRNPLQNINMGIDEIRSLVGPEENVAQVLEEMKYGVNSLNSIVSELLDYSRPTSLSVGNWTIAELVERAMNAVSDKLQNVEISHELQDKDRLVQVDGPKVVRVLVNLFSNAAEAMPDGGSIRVISRFCRQDSVEYLSISVSDTGPGMDEVHLQRIFEPFFTTKKRGTGLGIPICKKIVEAHNGTICYRSKLKEGTTVELLFPAA